MKTKTKFKFGDRVRVYGYDRDGIHLYDGERGKVLCEPDGIGMLQVRVAGELDESFVHEKQCRKLVKKKRRADEESALYQRARDTTGAVFASMSPEDVRTAYEMGAIGSWHCHGYVAGYTQGRADGVREVRGKR